MSDNKKLLLSISIRELREKHGIKLDLAPNRYRFEEVFDALVRQLQGKHSAHAADDNGNNGNNTKRNGRRKTNARKYLTGTKPIQVKYKCSFEEAEKILLEQRLHEELISTRKLLED